MPSSKIQPFQGDLVFLRPPEARRSLWFFSAQAAWSPKNPAWLPCLGLNPSTNLPLLHHFQLRPQLATAANIPIFFQLYWAAIVSPWSQSFPSSHTGTITRGSCLPVTSWVEVTLIPLAQSMVKLFNISMKPVKGYRYVK